MTVIYRSPLAIVFQGRSEDVLPTLAKASVDCIVTDPPYGQAYQSNFRRAIMDRIEGDDGLTDIQAVLRKACQALRGGRHLYVFGPDLAAGLPVGGSTELIWAKGNMSMGDLTAVWSQAHERIGFMVHVPSQANRADGKGKLAARLRKGSVLSVPRKNSRANSRHPTEKPVALLRQLIESSTSIGEVVLDPYAGVGSTAVAAIACGRRAIAIEVDPGYCQTIVNRVKEAEGLAQEIERL
jgi:site-specific DNA-methyltransferase (adenine-specific)